MNIREIESINDLTILLNIESTNAESRRSIQEENYLAGSKNNNVLNC